MNILHVNASVISGAARSAYRIQRSLVEALTGQWHPLDRGDRQQAHESARLVYTLPQDRSRLMRLLTAS